MSPIISEKKNIKEVKYFFMKQLKKRDMKIKIIVFLPLFRSLRPNEATQIIHLHIASQQQQTIFVFVNSFLKV